MIDDEKLSIRDKLAFAIFERIISNSNNHILDPNYYTNIDDETMKYFDKGSEKAIRMSYRTADLFRKIRLEPFK